jgi:hypothetical protein
VESIVVAYVIEGSVGEIVVAEYDGAATREATDAGPATQHIAAVRVIESTFAALSTFARAPPHPSIEGPNDAHICRSALARRLPSGAI